MAKLGDVPLGQPEEGQQQQPLANPPPAIVNPLLLTPYMLYYANMADELNWGNYMAILQCFSLQSQIAPIMLLDQTPSNIMAPQAFLTINIERHMHGTCIPGKVILGSEYHTYKSCICSYVITDMVPHSPYTHIVCAY